MTEFLIKLAITPIVLLASTQILNGVYVKSFSSAILSSLGILIVGFFFGWIFTLFANIATLGIFWVVGLGVVTRTIGNAIVIELVDAWSPGFTTKGFIPSLMLAIFLAISWGLVEWMF